MLSKSESIIVVGAGTFGLSTAWHLARAGYTDVTVIDRHDAPSIASAGYDLNKIFRTEYAEEAYTRLAKEAREVWLNEPVLRGCYHESGCTLRACLLGLLVTDRVDCRHLCRLRAQFTEVRNRSRPFLLLGAKLISLPQRRKLRGSRQQLASSWRRV